MKISLITPAKKHSKNGNRTTALRWARMLREAGHRVRVDVDYGGEAVDVMIAIHAWRSADAIARYRAKHPHGPLVLCLGGTDVNTYLHSHPGTTLRSMEMADALICLHALMGDELPPALRSKLHVVHQSALPLKTQRSPSKRNFDVCVIGHLRGEKDPFRTAMAARLLAKTSRVRVFHLGKAHTDAYAKQADIEMRKNQRYHWLGEVSGARVRREFAKTQVMVISSVQEGGANVISEAIMADVPIIASDIAGNVGLLGADYPGYYSVGDEVALSKLLARAETDPVFLETLLHQGQALKPQFKAAHEQAALVKIVKTFSK